MVLGHDMVPQVCFHAMLSWNGKCQDIDWWSWEHENHHSVKSCWREVPNTLHWEPPECQYHMLLQHVSLAWVLGERHLVKKTCKIKSVSNEKRAQINTHSKRPYQQIHYVHRQWQDGTRKGCKDRKVTPCLDSDNFCQPTMTHDHQWSSSGWTEQNWIFGLV